MSFQAFWCRSLAESRFFRSKRALFADWRPPGEKPERDTPPVMAPVSTADIVSRTSAPTPPWRQVQRRVGEASLRTGQDPDLIYGERK